ncbi:hypothetical protein C7G92_19070, partial [Acinetobacter baumannii]
MYGLFNPVCRAVRLEGSGNLCSRAAANDEVVVANPGCLAVNIDHEGLAANVEVGRSTEDELELVGAVLGEALGNGLEELLLGDLAGDDAARCRDVPEEVAVARHECDLVGRRSALADVLEEAVGGA